jgi:hypothetical protein
MNLRETGWGGMDWIHLAQDRDLWRALLSKVINLRVPQNAVKFLSNCTMGGFSGRARLHAVMKKCLKIQKAFGMSFDLPTRYRFSSVFKQTLRWFPGSKLLLRFPHTPLPI